LKLLESHELQKMYREDVYPDDGSHEPEELVGEEFVFRGKYFPGGFNYKKYSSEESKVVYCKLGEFCLKDITDEGKTYHH